MNTFESKNLNYHVLPVKVQNIDEPWIEIHQKSDICDASHNYIVVEPVVENNPLDIKDPLSIFNITGKELTTPTQIYGEYMYTDNYDTDETPKIVKASIACLKNTLSLKHISFSTFNAMTSLLNNIRVYNTDDQVLPYIILNTKCDVCNSPLNTFSDMVREITAAFINEYGEYPTIFVTFSDNNHLMESFNELCDDKKKKKKKKKDKKMKKRKDD